ncbi:MAG: exodeoxyribonuclease VII large subunit [Intestinimonas sp.]|jgi:exodeoxyribonuclease VII large subunit|nr:exodeoxyribonuclease VII large subunit [Intestinimonas sp.]
MKNEQPIFSVSQVNAYIKQLLDDDRLLGGLFVRGEISNYKAYPSGHHYFSLKDETGSIRCVMFRREAARLRFRPENGMKVLAFGRVAVFPRDGQYQLYCGTLSPDGIGDLHVAFEQLKERLYKEGLFDDRHKKPIPAYPEHIALITSPVGAAVRDMLRILGARYPLAKVFILPVRVQGQEAAGEIAAALRYADAHRVADLIIMGRGGGSMEDLWAFNEEVVARAIYHCSIPVISAVGHQPDVTIADFVADLRAATPSNGAELAVPDQNELTVLLRQMDGRMAHAVHSRLAGVRRDLLRLSASRALQDPMGPIQDRRLLLDYESRRLAHGLTASLAGQRERFVRLAAALDALSPLKVLGRGYAVAKAKTGRVLTSVEEAAPGDGLEVRLTDGVLDCRVTERRKL